MADKVSRGEAEVSASRNDEGVEVSKWGGIRVWAREFVERLNLEAEEEAQIEAELRRRVEPLLEAAEEAAEFIRNDEAYHKFKKELATWRK